MDIKFDEKARNLFKSAIFSVISVLFLVVLGQKKAGQATYLKHYKGLNSEGLGQGYLRVDQPSILAMLPVHAEQVNA